MADDESSSSKHPEVEPSMEQASQQSSRPRLRTVIAVLSGSAGALCAGFIVYSLMVRQPADAGLIVAIILAAILIGVCALMIRGKALKLAASSLEVITIIIAVLALVLSTAPSRPTHKHLPAPACPTPSPEALTSGRYAIPEVSSNVAQDLKFCPVDLNHGNSLTHHSFTMYGQVLGKVPNGKQLAMVSLAESDSQDRCRPPHYGTGAYFIDDGFEYDPVTKEWQNTFYYSYPAANSLKYRFSFVLTTASALEELRHELQKQKRTDHAPAGITSFPHGMYEAATFVTHAKGTGPPARC